MEEWEILGNSMITLIYHNDIALTLHPCLRCDQHIASPGVSRGQSAVLTVTTVSAQSQQQHPHSRQPDEAEQGSKADSQLNLL